MTEITGGCPQISTRLGLKKILMLLIIFGVWHTVCAVDLASLSDGGLLQEDVTIPRYASPFIIRDTLIVGVGATLTIEPGTVVRFFPGAMLAVNGTLIAQVRNKTSNIND